MTILVTGATGHVGREVVAQLVAAGAPVRALTRNPATATFPAGVEVVRGDLLEPESLEPALTGVDRLYLFPEPRTATEVVDAVKRAGVRRIVTLSSGAVTGGFDLDFQLPVEQAVEASGLEWTHLRPGEFMSNTLRLWGPMIRAERVVRYITPDAVSVAVHEADIAAVGVVALLKDGHTGKAYDMTGPERITVRQQVAAISAALGEEIRFEEVSAQEAKEILTRQGGWAAENADFLLGLEDYTPGAEMPQLTAEEWDQMLQPIPTVEEVTGRPARTYAQWARENAESFR